MIPIELKSNADLIIITNYIILVTFNYYHHLESCSLRQDQKKLFEPNFGPTWFLNLALLHHSHLWLC